MDLIIQAENLRYRSCPYTEYHVPNSIGDGPPVTILTRKGGVAILFIPEAPDIDIRSNFLKETVELHWQNFGSHIRDFVFYSFDPRIQPMEYEDSAIEDVWSMYDVAHIRYAEKFRRMHVELSLNFRHEMSFPSTPGMTANAAEEANEMGYIEGDVIEMFRGMDEKMRETWANRLKIDETKLLNDPYLRMRAIFEGKGMEPVGFLPFLIGQKDNMKIMKICLERKNRDWQHVRRVLFRSVHEKCPGKRLWVDCGSDDNELLQFLRSWGYNTDSYFWTGAFS